MKLSEESRKKAILAFKADFKVDLQYIRESLPGEASWDSAAIKGKLHRLKGGASFLELEEIRTILSQLESKCMVKPLVSNDWLIELDKLEKLVEALN